MTVPVEFGQERERTRLPVLTVSGAQVADDEFDGLGDDVRRALKGQAVAVAPAPDRRSTIVVASRWPGRGPEGLHRSLDRFDRRSPVIA